MKIAVIRQLVETYELTTLEQAELDVSEGREPQISIEGAHEGEMLTHAYAAVWIKRKVTTEGVTLALAIREFSQKIRNSLG